MVDVSKIEVDELKARAEGRWLEIFSLLAPELDEAIARLGRHVACPMHSSPDGFRLFRDAAETGGGICSSCGAFHDGFALLRALRSWSFPEVLAHVAEALGGIATNVRSQPAPKPQPASKRDAREGLRRLWKAGKADREARRLLEDYLATRGLSPALAATWLEQARVHPSLPYRNDDKEVVGSWPCVLTLVRGVGGKAVTLHRTWLTRLDDCTVAKAPVAHPKKLYPAAKGRTISGGAIRLGEPVGRTLGIAEGIETALAVAGATGMTVWACWSASLLPSFVPPEGIDTVVIWADKDREEAGLKAARSLQQRLWSQGIKAALQLPDAPFPAGAKSVDWADVFAAEQRPGPLSLLL